MDLDLWQDLDVAVHVSRKCETRYAAVFEHETDSNQPLTECRLAARGRSV